MCYLLEQLFVCLFVCLFVVFDIGAIVIFYLSADKLYTVCPGENETCLPSPQSLKGKILIKVCLSVSPV